MANEAKEKAFKTFEESGVDYVRLAYQGNAPDGASVERKLWFSWAKEWLATHERESRLAEEADKEEAKRMARSAKNAAWAAAIAAIIAAVAAIASALIAFSSLPS